MIAYRYQKKDSEWQWLQTSSRLVYKNSKPDFVICTHRQLMEEEGRDLLGKRTMDFKVSKTPNWFKTNNSFTIRIRYYRLAIWTRVLLRHISPNPINSSFRQSDRLDRFQLQSPHPKGRRAGTRPNCGTSFRRAARNANCNSNRDQLELYVFASNLISNRKTSLFYNPKSTIRLKYIYI